MRDAALRRILDIRSAVWRTQGSQLRPCLAPSGTRSHSVATRRRIENTPFSPLAPAKRSSRSCKCLFNGFRSTIDDCQICPRGRIGREPPLLPIPKTGNAKAVFDAKLLLGKAASRPDGLYIDLGGYEYLIGRCIGFAASNRARFLRGLDY